MTTVHFGGGMKSNDPEVLDEDDLRESRIRCLRIFDFLLLFTSAGVCGASLYASNSVILDAVSPPVLAAAAGIAGALFTANILGLFTVCGGVHTRVLLLVRGGRFGIAR